jgi:hypothetical protein
MALYYGKNKLSTTNVKLSELYQLKGVNIDQDKPSNMRLAAQGSNTEGAHLGPGLNPWISIYNGWVSTDPRLGLVGINSPITTTNQPSLSWVRGGDWKYTPFLWFSVGIGGSTRSITLNSDVNMWDSVNSPGWSQGKYCGTYFYATADPGLKLVLSDANYIAFSQRVIGGTNSIQIGVGNLTCAGVMGSPSAPYATTSFAGVNFQVAPLNLGQGDDTPYNTGQSLGSSTQHVCHYRNNSAQNKARVITTNTSHTATPTISAGAEQSPTNRGNPVFTHGCLNMGKGAAWAGFHRGANYQRVQYAYWTSGTTFSTISDLLVTSRSSSNTLHHGWMVKLSDEQCLWFFPRRNGNTSGSSRYISVTALYANGSSKTPVVRGSSELAGFDIGSISTEGVAAAVGSSNRSDIVWGIVGWAETGSGNDSYNIVSWKYTISTNTLVFQTGGQYVSDTSYTGTNAYRMHAGIKCLGWHEDENVNFYEIIIPLGDAAGGGVGRLIMEQNADDGGTGVLTEREWTGNFLSDTTVRVMGQQHFFGWGHNDNRGWFIDAISSPAELGEIYPFVDSSNVLKMKTAQIQMNL